MTPTSKERADITEDRSTSRRDAQVEMHNVIYYGLRQLKQSSSLSRGRGSWRNLFTAPHQAVKDGTKQAGKETAAHSAA